MAADYDRSRPDYPEQLVRDVLSHVAAGVIPQAGGATRALEVGAGTGKATLQFAAHGVAIHAMEPSAEMGRILADRCIFQRKVTIERSEFESAELAGAELRACLQRPGLALDRSGASVRARPPCARRRGHAGGLLERAGLAGLRACRTAGVGLPASGVRLSNNGPMVPRRHAPMHLAGEQGAVRSRPPTASMSPSPLLPVAHHLPDLGLPDLLATHSDHALLAADPRWSLCDEIAGVIDGAGRRDRASLPTCSVSHGRCECRRAAPARERDSVVSAARRRVLRCIRWRRRRARVPRSLLLRARSALTPRKMTNTTGDDRRHRQDHRPVLLQEGADATEHRLCVVAGDPQRQHDRDEREHEAELKMNSIRNLVRWRDV